MRDVAAACLFLKEHTGGDERLVLAGYSFGAWVCARAASGVIRDISLCLVAYPFSVYRAEELRAFRGKICFIGGSLDEISPLDALLALYRELPADKSLKVVRSGHTFDGEETEITAFIREMFGKPSEAS
jgi:alpha/beta superfamily hydrolase